MVLRGTPTLRIVTRPRQISSPRHPASMVGRQGPRGREAAWTESVGGVGVAFLAARAAEQLRAFRVFPRLASCWWKFPRAYYLALQMVVTIANAIRAKRFIWLFVRCVHITANRLLTFRAKHAFYFDTSIVLRPTIEQGLGITLSRQLSTEPHAALYLPGWTTAQNR